MPVDRHLTGKPPLGLWDLVCLYMFTNVWYHVVLRNALIYYEIRPKYFIQVWLNKHYHANVGPSHVIQMHIIPSKCMVLVLGMSCL